jgi:hypothetical protein
MRIRIPMKRFPAAFLIATLAGASDSRGLFSEVGSIEKDLTEITGLPFHHNVPYAVMNKDELRRFLEKRLRDEVKPADIHAEELTLKMFGLIPQDFDLRQETVDLYTEQAAAFYDYNKKKLFILEGGEAAGSSKDSAPSNPLASDQAGDRAAEQRMALAHELAHALADQHFHLNKFIRAGLRSDDGSTARLAVMEGQASWLMSAYLSMENGGPPDVAEPALRAMAKSLAEGGDEYPVFSKAPLYIRESLVFPYSEGMLFQDAIYRKLGRIAFSEVFQRAPDSTQQILHPEKYLAHVASETVDLPRPPRPKQFHALAEGTLGELDLRVLLTQYIGKEEGEPAAAHFSGGAYELIEQKRGKYAVLGFATIWDSPESAQLFFGIYRRVLNGKWKKLTMSRESATSLEGHGDSGYFHIWLDGRTVQALEGFQSPLN